MNKKITCPCCGADITDLIVKALKEKSAKGGRTKTDRKIASSAANMRKAAAAANASYTPEKRKAAAEKRRATMAAKKKTNAGSK